MHSNFRHLCLVLLTSLLLCACATKVRDPNDPLEPFNRAAFKFNTTLDDYLVKPAAKVYNTVLPKPFTSCIHNAFGNIGELPTIANDLLQFNFYQALSDTWRFLFNSTLGIGGCFDVAKHIGLPHNYEDFGLTLARWGYRKSPYLVIPFFGPSTIRDAFSKPADYLFFSMYPWIRSTQLRYGIYAVGVIDTRADLLKYQNVFEQAAIDKYIFTRNAYLQRRNYLIKRNNDLSDPYQKDEMANDLEFNFFNEGGSEEANSQDSSPTNNTDVLVKEKSITQKKPAASSSLLNNTPIKPLAHKQSPARKIRSPSDQKGMLQHSSLKTPSSVSLSEAAKAISFFKIKIDEKARV
jgi:phospholipid-binding lipoprotein MlaA